MLIDNINYLRKHHRSIREYLKDHEDELKNRPIQVIESKNGQPTLLIERDDKKIYIHSMYNPLYEAEQIVEKYKNTIDDYNHVFFYGIGLGYVIEVFVKYFPKKTFTIYEPNPAVFYHFLSVKKLEDLPMRNIKYIHVQTSEEDQVNFLNEFSNQLDSNILLIPLPSYERIFNDQYMTFLDQFKERVINKRSEFHTNLAFEKRWTINSMINFPKVIRTPNILHDVDKSYFKGKPAIIISAGPSLDEEIENLRYIKENKLAYLFAVGSSNKTLIKNQIYPDAVCTYDPQGHNTRVYQEIIEKNIKEIPMIFGSSVGFETVEKYPGLKFHMLTSQDTISSYYLEDKDQTLKRVNDAPSIAVVTLQLLCQLEANPIILVGQNLGYKGEYFYSSGINYGNKNTLSEEELTHALTVKDVEGNIIYTNQSFLKMKTDMEKYIKHYSNIKVFNTTSGGAHIEGTIYEPLRVLISQLLGQKVVSSAWFTLRRNRYNLDLVKERQRLMDESLTKFRDNVLRWASIVHNMEKYANEENIQALERQFIKFDSAVKGVIHNKFFKVFIQPMVRVSFDLFIKKIKTARFNKDTLTKAQDIVKASSMFINECQTNFVNILPIYEKMNQDLNKSEYMEA